MEKKMNFLKRLFALIQGLPADVYEDELIGDGFWKNPQWGNLYRPFGVEYRIVEQAGSMLLEIKLADGNWVEAQEYDYGYDDMGKLKKGCWRQLSGSRAASMDCYRIIGNGLTGANVKPNRMMLVESSRAA